MGFPGGDRLLQVVKQQYFWPGMNVMCKEAAATHPGHRQEMARFKPPPYLFPTNKPNAPFRLWCIDTIVGLRPPSPSGATDIVLAVDPFSKWVEAREVPVLNSHSTMVFFHTEVVCRYGVPFGVRSDQGTEY